MSNFIHSFSSIFDVWTTTRAAGLAAYLLLTFSMVFGILQGYPNISAKTKATFYTIHESTSWFGLLVALLHGFVLIYDKYVGYSFYEIFIPFTSNDKPIFTGLGTMAFYLMLLLIVTSDLRHKMNKKAWKVIHYLSILSFAAALIHGIYQGTDSQYMIVNYMYWATGLLVAGVAFLRPNKPKNVTKRPTPTPKPDNTTN